MKKNIRFLSTLLALLMLLGSFSVLFATTASAAVISESEKKIAQVYLKDNIYRNPEEKLASMTKMMEKCGYELWADGVSGEVAVREIASGNILFSNPYDVASSTGSNLFKNNATGTKEQLLMSQIIVTFTDNGVTKYLYSFQDAAMRGQISLSKIKNGIRMEYIIGQEAFRKLVPRWIPVESFDTLIKDPLDKALADGLITPHKYERFMSYYVTNKKDPSEETIASIIEAMIKNYPICETIPIYVCDDSKASSKILNELESVIKTYCSDTYSFEQMDADHETTGYVAENESYPVFKLALEYGLNENGLEVKLSCAGLQYDVSKYTLEDISILPYMGAGNTKNEGYNFYPDGSGALFDFNLGKQTTVRGKIYGTDYAYHEVTGTYQKAIRYPVYGTVATEIYYTYSYNELNEDSTVKATYQDIRVSNTVMTKAEIQEFLKGENIQQIANSNETEIKITESTKQRGYVAIIESGESLAEIETYFAGALSNYATMSNHFNPKPKDSYDIADSISVTSSSTWTVVSNRKYTGTIKIQYQLLCDEKLGEEIKASNSSYTYYEATWLGMAEAYRAYLLSKGKLQKLTEEDVEEDIPLYIESFGALEVQKTIATIPVNVMTPLTSFDDVWTMYQELSEAGAKNINFKLTGYANGGMNSTIPSSLKWEKAVGGKSGFKELVENANEVAEKNDGSHLGLYPDFDFAYSSENTMFDALNLKKDAVRTIDDRYSSKRLYSATQQKYVSFFELAISPSRYSKFYEKLLKKLDKYENFNSISVATLGNTLNSDFDEDDPFNREDSKSYTITAFSDLQEAGYSLMTSGGNAYTWSYVDHILDVDLDSSRYVKSCASVPFIGAVLHGYVQFAGTPLNEEGDINYAMLKAIENGAGMYFILSYQNTQELKEDVLLSQYYSIRYDIWKEDMVNYYLTLNNLLKDLQTKIIIDHEFLNYDDTDKNGNQYNTERVLDIDELKIAIAEEMAKAEEESRQKLIDEEIGRIATVADARLALENAEDTINAIIESREVIYQQILANIASLNTILTKEAELLTVEDFDQATGLMVAICKAYEQTVYQTSLLDAEQTNLQNAVQIVTEAKQGDASLAYQITRANELFAAAQLQITNAKTAQTTFYNGVDAFGGLTVEAFLTGKLADLNALVATYNSGLEEGKQAYVASTIENVQKNGKYIVVDASASTEEVAATVLSKYAVTNNRVVAVTYGDVDANNNQTAYRTFLLNYNNFAVSITYKNVVYTIDGCGYVVINY